MEKSQKLFIWCFKFLIREEKALPDPDTAGPGLTGVLRTMKFETDG